MDYLDLNFKFVSPSKPFVSANTAPSLLDLKIIQSAGILSSSLIFIIFPTYKSSQLQFISFALFIIGSKLIFFNCLLLFMSFSIFL